MFKKWITLLIGALALSVVLMIPTRPAEAQSSVWTAQYYGNSFMFEPPVFTQNVGAVAFDWGLGSPGGGMNNDGFTIRFATDPYFPAGTYRFWALADDEVRVNVGFQYNAQIDTFGKNQVGQLIYADITLTEGVHHVQVDFRETIGNAYVYVNWANLASNPTGPNFPTPSQPVAVSGGTWTASYYPNVTFSGTPGAIQSESSPSHNWGTGAPIASIPADNWSARWTSTQNLSGGQYNLSVKADDGVRVFVDGVSVIDEFHGATGATYTKTLTLSPGGHTFQVDYFEGGGAAFLEFTLSQQGSGLGSGGGQPAPSQPVQTGTTATVTALRLNVRSSPETTATILLKVNRNESYPVTGSNSDRSWYQVNVNGVTGWVFGRFVSISGAGVPVVNPGGSPSVSQPVDTGYNVTALDTVNIRSGPGTSNAVLGKLPRNATARVVGRTSNNAWWQVNYDGLIGWTSSTFAQIQPDAETGRIPVTG